MIWNSFTTTYLLLSFLSLFVGLFAVIIGWHTGRKWSPLSSAEEQYELEKKVYLIITLITLGLYIRLALVPLWFLTLQSLIPSIPGAMCLTGVHMANTPFSFIASTFKFIIPLFYGYWLILNAIDRRIETQPFMKTKLSTLVPIGILMLAESSLDLKFLLPLQPRRVTCCTSVFDMPGEGVPEIITTSTWLWAVVFYILIAILIGTLILIHKKPKYKNISRNFTGIAPVALVVFILALHTKISPLFLHAPFHHCVFCLWQNTWDVALITILIIVGLWLALIYPWIIRLAKYQGAEEIVKRDSRILIKWVLGCLITGLTILTVHLIILMVS